MMRLSCFLWICIFFTVPSMLFSRPFKEDIAPTDPDKRDHRDEPARKILNHRPGYKVYDEGPDSVPQDERTFEHETRGKDNIEDPHPALPVKRYFNYGTGIGHHTHDDEEQYLNDLEELLDSFGHILIDES